MKQAFLISAIFVLLISCTTEESYRQIDAGKFNEEIAANATIETPNDLITLFYKKYKGGKEEATPISTPREDGSFKIFLIANVKNDGCKTEEQIIMNASRQGKIWHVNEIKENWKCKGNDKWGTEPCK